RGVLARSTGPFVGVIGVSDLMIVAEPDAVLVCRRDDAQAVKALVDGLKAKGRELAQRHPNVVGGGVERRSVVDTDHASVELRRLATGATAMLPAASVQVLGGVLRGPAGDWAAGDRLELTGETQVTAATAATLLVTSWR
ncbi:MAG: mannose-1-phosphate guanylyltransferase, partial [Caulobacter sp.]|nr:mannose-1-phosphate guanylyltransferase [Caulobacter sp.]